jgi:proliferating cell nuclear antigen PCNA
MDILLCDPEKINVFASIFQHIKVFTETINIIFYKDKVFMQSMDSSHVTVFEITLPAVWFDKYIHQGETPHTLGLHSSILFRILNARDKTHKINIIYDTEEVDKLYLHFTSDKKAEFDKRFEIILIELETEYMEIPEIEHEAEFTLDSFNFANIINQLKMFGDNLSIKCSEEDIVLYSSSQDQGKMFVNIKIDDLTTFVINEGSNIELSFSLAYLHNICLYNKLSKEIDIKIAKDYPMKIVYRIAGHDDANMTFYLAPKLDD